MASTNLTKIHNYYKLVSYSPMEEVETTQAGVLYVYPPQVDGEGNNCSQVKYGTGADGETLATAPYLGSVATGRSILDDQQNIDAGLDNSYQRVYISEEGWANRESYTKEYSVEKSLIFGNFNTLVATETDAVPVAAKYNTIVGRYNSVQGDHGIALGSNNILTQFGYAGIQTSDGMSLIPNHFPNTVYEQDYDEVATTGIFNTAIGYKNELHGSWGLAIGRHNIIESSEHGIAFGKHCRVYKDPDFKYMHPSRPNEECPSISDAIAGGFWSVSTRNESVAFGQCCVSYGSQGFALGECALVDKDAEGAFSLGCHTVARGDGQFVIGRSNIVDTEIDPATNQPKYLFIIGNGTFTDAAVAGEGTDTCEEILDKHPSGKFRDFVVERSNAFTVDQQGNGEFSGGVTCTGSITIGNTTITEDQLQQLLSILTNNLDEVSF